MTIVTTAYRDKRPRKRKAVAIAGPAIVRKVKGSPTGPVTRCDGSEPAAKCVR